MTQQDQNEEQQRDNAQQQGNNETQQVDNVTTQQVSNESVERLAAAVLSLTGMFRRARVERVLLWVVVVAMIVLATVYYRDVQDRREKAANDKTSQNDRINGLACFLVRDVPNDPARPQIAEFRLVYHCPPFKRSGG